MVAIKGGIFTGAFGLAFWRLGRAINLQPTVAYLASVALSGFAMGVLWSLTLLGLGSGLFWFGLLVGLWGVSRDREMLRGWITEGADGPFASDSVVSGGGNPVDRPKSQHPDPTAREEQPEQEQTGNGPLPGTDEAQRDGGDQEEDARAYQTDHQPRHGGSHPVPAGVTSSALGEE
jgi:hypothetical protein